MIADWTNHIWQSTLFAFAVWLLTLAFRESRAGVRYWLWFSASVKFLLPFALLMNLGSRAEWHPAPAELITPSVSQAVVQLSQPFDVQLPMPTSPGSSFDGTILVVLGVWAGGLSIVAFTRVRGWLRVRAAIRAGTPVDLPALMEVRSVPGQVEVGVVGVLRPVLLVPANVLERLTPHQLDSVLAHEFCHVKRRDNLTAAVHMVVEMLFWFHPLVWWIGARLVEERERACDEEVLRLGNEPAVYAEGILNICRSYVESPSRCVAGVTGADLKKRLNKILAGRVARELTLPKQMILAIAGAAAVAIPIVIGALNTGFMKAQEKAAARFEVASIRRCKDAEGGRRAGGYVTNGKLNTGCMVLVDAANSLGLIQRAYVRFAEGRSHPFGVVPITGGPAWVHSESYIINAIAEGNPSAEMMQGPMLQALLEERFKLSVRSETREVPVYALQARSGVKLQPSKNGCVPMPMTFPVPPLPPGQQYCKNFVGGRKGHNITLHADSASMDEFAKLLSLVLDRPVIDKTGIAGKFALDLEFAIDDTTPRYLPGGDMTGTPNVGAASEPAGPSIFSAVQQLGLKLERSRGPRVHMVIDHVERPSEN